ncbi:EAL domain-containing protein [Methylobacterium soli]|uniref:EAL domain-containing protein n=1 Tax=Methylobacterium soli TaxID=553447 RepID=A0A6L3T427_9HYPH|nr:EAL domain-containing protein [Methylobacterium soli]GJE42782.1 hypothetical protein AEGHOMDF_1955 [Methylobacterium soli]
MLTLKTFLKPFTVPPDAPEMHVAQIHALAKQAPLFYGVLWINVAILVYDHLDHCPPWLTYLPLLLFTIGCTTRGLHYHRLSRCALTGEVAYRQLQTLNRAVFAMFMAMTGWSIVLTHYGNAGTQMHVMFFMTFTMLASIFGLMHVRSAALCCATAIPVWGLYFLSIGNTTQQLIAGSFLVFSSAATYLIYVYHEVFFSLVKQHAELHRLGSENLRLANSDLLTNLPNRRSFFTHLDSALAESEGRALHVALIDLDGFKPVNDTYGHPAGDAVLCEIGRRLGSLAGPHCLVSRLGGDEFGIVLTGLDAEDGVAEFGRAVCAAVARPIVLAHGVVQVGCCVGLAGLGESGRNWARLIEHADYALYHAKAQFRGSAVVFSRELERRRDWRDRVQQALHQADFEREMRVVLQPLVDAEAGRIVGFEALARWTSPSLGGVGPGDFIPVAEGIGIVCRMTEILLVKALAAAAHWPPGIGLSFNLSSQDIAHPQIAARIAVLIRASGVSPARITFEVTETSLIQDFVKAKQTLDALKALGCTIALDDFGTGFSSLSYVHRLPIDRLKIDRSFISEVTENDTCRDVVRTVINLCRTLKLGCVVEGVETAEQVSVLTNLGCEMMQGFYFHPPMEAEAVDALLARTDRIDALLAAPARAA